MSLVWPLTSVLRYLLYSSSVSATTGLPWWLTTREIHLIDRACVCATPVKSESAIGRCLPMIPLRLNSERFVCERGISNQSVSRRARAQVPGLYLKCHLKTPVSFDTGIFEFLRVEERSEKLFDDTYTSIFRIALTTSLFALASVG